MISLSEHEIQKGDVLDGPLWDERVEVKAVENVGSATKIYAVGLESREGYDPLLSEEKLDRVSVTKKETSPAFDGDPNRFKQAVETARIDLASEYDPHHALSTSQVDPVPHQLEAVYDYILPLNQISFFLADDAGAGKTIMAGLLLKELKQRGIVDNCLILSPASLQEQWQKELMRLFDEEFRIIRRAHVKGTYGNVWEENQFCIASMAFCIQDYVKETLKDNVWDLVIVDEAHHLSAYRRGADNEEERTERYKVGELLRKNSLNRLFLSATPHKGDPDNFQLLLRLLDEDLFAEAELPEEIIRSDDPGTVFLRRMKEDMVDLHGQPLFEDRDVHTVRYQIDGEELAFYKQVTQYVEEQMQRAWNKENRNVQFALIILQRRVASSIEAARKSLQRRKEGLEELYEDVEKLRESQQGGQAPDPADLEEMAEKQRWEIEEEALQRLTNNTNRRELKQEIQTLEELVRRAEKLKAKGTERKLEELRRLLKGQKEDAPFFEGEKLIIFTEAKDTLDFLVENLRNWGYSVATIHGGLDMGDSKNPAEGTRLWAQDKFNNPDGPQILVATEAAGEGINLHRECRLMVNYDLPWNPTLLEQRMGRIHRYGQEDPVHIYNMVASNTREGHVLDILSTKLEQMKNDIGSDRVFDVISELAEEVRLDRLIRDVVAGTTDQRDAEARLDKLDSQAEEAVERATQQGLATRHINLSEVQKWLRRDKEKRLSPEYIEKFFVNSFQLLDGKIEQRKDGYWRIEWVPAEFRDEAHGSANRPPDTSYPKFTFYKDESDIDDRTEFVAPGHPLFEAVASKAQARFQETLNKGTTYIDPDATDPYLIWFIRQNLENGNGATVAERVFAVRQPEDGPLEQVNEAILHDLTPITDPLNPQQLEDLTTLYQEKDKVISWFYDNVVADYAARTEEEQEGIVKTIRPSMKQALQSAILNLNEEIQELKERQREGEQVDRPLGNKEKKRSELVQRRDQQLQNLEQRANVVPSSPRVMGLAVVLPPDEDEREEYGGMSRDDDVEEAAMQKVMEHEEAHGRAPEDVAEENLGFDIRSLDKDEAGRITEARYIEVKGRSGEGSISLTSNEWTMAHRLSDEYWLYIVPNAIDDPSLFKIQNPSTKLDPDQRKVVRYLVPPDEWQREAGED